MNNLEKLEKLITSVVFYIVPVIVFIILLGAYKSIIGGEELQGLFAGRGLNLLIFLLFIKPLYVISKKYFEAKSWQISDFLEYILKGRIQKPILIFIKELIANTVYSLSGLFLKYRRLLGIMTFWFIFLHLTLLLIGRNKLGIEIFSNIGETFVWIGYVGISSLFIGALTSNNLSMKRLGKYRKIVQQIAYLALFAGALHSSLGEGEIGGAIVLIVIYAVLKYFEWSNIKLKRSDLNTEVGDGNNGSKDFKEWKCNPCGYIYSEELGDPDGGISPGTKREDVPNERKCPICGVGKDQFTMIIRKDNKAKYILGKVINRRMLTENVLELNVEFKENLETKPGQWIGFVFDDQQGEFVRAYSIAYHENENDVTDCVFVIKLLEEGRGGKKLKELKIGDEVKVNGVFGHFVLNRNDNEKVFIATGTGLAPIMNMMRSSGKEIKKTLAFGAQMKKDIFYEDEMKKIPNLDYKIFLSREDVGGYEYGRIDLSKFELNDNMEYYICGAPPVVKSMLEALKAKGFTKVYYEQFF